MAPWLTLKRCAKVANLLYLSTRRPTMQTLAVLAALLAAAAAATIPEQEALLITVELPEYGFFHENNASTAAPAQHGDHQPATTSRPNNERLTYADSEPQSPPPAQPEDNVANHEAPLEQSIQQPHSQPETPAVEAVHIVQAAGENVTHDTQYSNTTHAAAQSSQVDQAHQAQPAQPAHQTQPAQPARIAHQAQPAQRAQPTQPAYQAQPNQPDQPAHQATPAQPAHQAQPAQPAHQAQPAHEAQQPKQGKQAATLKETAVTSAQPRQSYNTQETTPTPQAETTSAAPQEPLNLSSGASFMLGAISTTFSCLDRPYGYYADPDNHCRIFHVCNPSFLSDGSVHTYQYSFMCGEGTVFDQKEMTCVAEWAATPCPEASSFYLRNQEFGQVQERRP
ncbi:activating signal cointegrator 1 complex subunit 2 homolog [Portunus trituberculatus]|uniref:activating signal cointegrator 1 complex subunit 2 homolog n=1 Tax=Portunus trituberculatus TaxID=210409 RepID=UPI001E1CE06B|nr:activating signal cointegrator 1 complex subunit 2 homolog [Portunus trituberculatus]